MVDLFQTYQMTPLLGHKQGREDIYWVLDL